MQYASRIEQRSKWDKPQQSPCNDVPFRIITSTLHAAPPGSWRPLTMAGNPGLPTFIAPMIPNIHLNQHRLGFVDTTLTPHILQGADTTLYTVAQAGSWR